jgi:hypothetical protein
MNQLNEGELQKAAPEVISKAKEQIVSNVEELLEVGARIRPLLVGKARIGWVRGVHLSERKQVTRYLSDPIEIMVQIVRTGTTLTATEIELLDTFELRSILRVIAAMTNSDLRLYPFMTPFVTTSVSEQLWFSRGAELTAFSKKTVDLPDGQCMQILSAPDHARLWATLCNYREQAKSHTKASMNALMIVRPWVGKAADGIASELKAAAKALIPDRIEPWTEAVKIRSRAPVDDGWAHGEDDSVEGVQRELQGMLNNDRHEQLIALFEKQQREKAEREVEELEKKIVKRGGPGFVEQAVNFEVSPANIQERVRRTQEAQRQHATSETELIQNNVDGLSRYV